MSVEYTKLFTETDAITDEPFTILVETIDPLGGETLVVVKILGGDYDIREEFKDAREYAIKRRERRYTRDKADEKLCISITLTISGTRHLVDSLNKALQAYEEG